MRYRSFWCCEHLSWACHTEWWTNHMTLSLILLFLSGHFPKVYTKMLNMKICGTDAWMFWQYLLPAGVKSLSISLSKGFLLWSLITALSSTVFTTCFVNTAQSSEIRWFKACFRCWTFHVLNLMLIS